MGDEIITPLAVKVPDGQDWTKLSDDQRLEIFRKAKVGGWLQAISRSYRRNDLPAEERQRNLQAIVNAAKKEGVPIEQIKSQLESLGVAVERKTEPVAQPDEVRVRGYLSEISAQALLAMEGKLNPQTLQQIVNEAQEAGISRDRIRTELDKLGVPIEEKGRQQDAATSQGIQTETRLPENLTPRDYNDLAGRFNDIRGKLIREGSADKLKRFQGLPYGQLFHAAFTGGDDNTRSAYLKIKQILDEIERS